LEGHSEWRLYTIGHHPARHSAPVQDDADPTADAEALCPTIVRPGVRDEVVEGTRDGSNVGQHPYHSFARLTGSGTVPGRQSARQVGGLADRYSVERQLTLFLVTFGLGIAH